MPNYQICKEGGMPHPRTSYCDAGINHPTSNKHKGDVMERREWYIGSRSNHEATIREGGALVGRVDVCFADMIVTEHNQHTALVEQRDLLVGIAKDALRFREETHGKCDHDEAMTKLCTQCEIRATLATVEQGGEA